MPGAMGTQHLPRACGIRRAKELIYTGKEFSTNEAYEWNIVNKICDSKPLLSDAQVTAKLITNNPPLSIR